MADKTIRYIFLLTALLIIVAYFAGFVTDVNAAGSNLTKLLYALSGRNSTGDTFSAYPSGGPSITG